MSSAILNLLKAITPLVIQELIKAAASNVGGFQLWIVRMIIKYGGRQLIEAINEGIRKSDRSEEQNKAKQEFDKVMNDPNSTQDQKGEAFEKYYNTRGPKP